MPNSNPLPFARRKKYRAKKVVNQQLRAESNGLGQERSSLYDALNELKTIAQNYYSYSRREIKSLEKRGRGLL
jgi:hypothetical protein